ncbi:hypothetical protein [Lapidilactobacillus bayanensis]|uniref:hypothetical protein n=1 Tax=Lapidilactobacillus bayanensis TaxID=2485998 RepID=UPI000F787C86|nr:hypothetical protein [Lapidilactobacillus bayanensis]
MDLIENQIPACVEKGSIEHARFLFFVASNDHGLKSSAMYSKALNLYNTHPEYFVPNKIVTMDEQSIKREILTPLGSRYPNAMAKAWLENSKALCKIYKGEPLNVFNSTNDAVTLLKKIQAFKGYGPKISAMLVRACSSLIFISRLEHLENVLVPVDVHDARTLFRSGGLYATDYEQNYTKYVSTAQREILEACNRNKLEWPKVDRSLWLLASNGLMDKLKLDEIKRDF